MELAGGNAGFGSVDSAERDEADAGLGAGVAGRDQPLSRPLPVRGLGLVSGSGSIFPFVKNFWKIFSHLPHVYL